MAVLVVDDEIDFADATAERLERHGFRAVPVYSGAAALERLRGDAFDVVLLDLKMPGMDGLTVLKTVRRTDPDLQVVVLTGHGTVASGIEGMQIGAADFLQKPADFDVLCMAVRAAAETTRDRRQVRRGGSS